MTQIDLTEEQTKELKQILLDRKEHIEEQLEKLRKSLDLGDDIDGFDTETDEAEEYANFIGVEKALNDYIKDIKDALKRLEKDEYGACLECDHKISYKILKMNPSTRLCHDCKVKNK